MDALQHKLPTLQSPPWFTVMVLFRLKHIESFHRAWQHIQYGVGWPMVTPLLARRASARNTDVSAKSPKAATAIILAVATHNDRGSY
jgi:hypothetical protein